MDLSFLLVRYLIEVGLLAAGLVGLGFAAGWWARGNR